MLIKTRFAPSPTGKLHFGNIRTALYSWLYARKKNGIFVLRIEDTDLKRSHLKFSKNIIDTLKWLKLNWDEGPYFQSNRIKHYQEIINFMLKKGFAYKCYCGYTKLNLIKKKQLIKGKKIKYDRSCRNLKKSFNSLKKYVVRFKNPLFGNITFKDVIRGNITVNNSELDDFIIQRENGIPTYNFCVVIDDLDSQITHVIRGEDHINNTPRQINILNSLGAKIPNYAHLSMILDKNKKTLSKRDNLLSVLKYKKLGYLPESILNYIVRLGWSSGNKEIFNLQEMIELFNFKSITKSASIFDIKKLLWINKYYINTLELRKIKNFLISIFEEKKIDFKNGPLLEDLIPIFSPRIYTMYELFNEISFFYNGMLIKYNKKYIKKFFNVQFFYTLNKSYIFFSRLSKWDIKNILKCIKNLSKILNISLKNIIIPIRVALTGKINSIGINYIIFFLGKKKTLLRLKNFLECFEK
jgi:glutamyl-tRNA synthetase